MRTVACVKAGPLYSAHYVNVLHAAVARHLDQPYRFLCLTDDASGLAEGIEVAPLTPKRVGWWNKIDLFKPGQFDGRVLYIDLDQIIVGPLARFFDVRGIIYLTDWGWKTHSYGSGVMVWDAGEHENVWRNYTPDVAKRHRGDQDWMTELGGWERLPPGWTCSYRYHAIKNPPAGCSIVCFHGRPKQTDLPADHWVMKFWTLGE